MEKIKIGYLADGPWSHEAFKLLILDPKIDIQYIVPRKDTADQTLYNFCKEHSIDYLPNENINSESFIERVKYYKTDLLVSMSFNQIFKKEILETPLLGIINCHAGKLPFYRGRNILNWVLINDEKEFGITVHFVDEGIDTGNIITQRSYPITDQDTYKSLLNIAYKECGKLLHESIQLILNNKVVPRIQNEIHATGFYCGRRTVGDEFINWNASSRDIFNFIRAICSPGPKAHTKLKGNVLTINSAKYFKNAPKYIGKPGQVLNKTPEGYLVKTLDSFIEVKEIDTPLNIKIGDVLA